ncbi:EamA family transporter [Halobellus clavatus]|jgi:transporter family protein|uniref:Transporter family protein n=1 Tax=Halobellus clavatus TaxID=660517 RepID=A0A1H3FLV3_9EURY|nr:DMT family transporter [Halobellus clavatus]SDX91348.1 transporter family protein [Halobellus clavatus]
MEYLPWVIVAVISYGALAPLTSKVTQEIPPAVSLFLATIVFLVLTLGVLVVTGTSPLAYVGSPRAGYIYVGGVFLGIGILSYYYALQRGPVSVVVPIYGLFIVGSSVVGILVLDETVTLPRIGGIGAAVLAIYLSSGAE